MFRQDRHKPSLHITRRWGHKEYALILHRHNHLDFICIWSLLIIQYPFEQTSDQQHLPCQNPHSIKTLRLKKGMPLSSRVDLSTILDLDQGDMSSCRWFSKAVVQNISPRSKFWVSIDQLLKLISHRLNRYMPSLSTHFYWILISRSWDSIF